MRSRGPLFFIVTALSLLSGYLLSKASLVGKFGISMFYTQYKFLKTWWQGAAVILAILSFLILLLELAERSLVSSKMKIVSAGIIILALLGTCLTYYDFKNTTSHRLLGRQFHMGAYLFWLNCVIIGSFYLRQEKLKDITP